MQRGLRVVGAWLGRGLVLMVALGAGALWAVHQVTDAGAWWAELLRYAPYPAWLLPALLALVVSWPLGWWWRGLAVVALAVVLGPVMGLSLGRGSEPAQLSAHRTPLRVMTYNIKSYLAEASDDAYTLLAQEISRQAPDVLLMQDGPHLNRPGRLNPAMRAALAPYHWQGVDQYVIASRYPLRDCRTGNLSVQGPPWSYLRCTVEVGTRQVTVVNVHTLTPRQGLNATRSERLEGVEEWRENFAIRMSQARRLADDLVRLPQPWIVAGDLNASQSSPVVQALLAVGLRDAFGEAGLGWGYTVGHALRPHLSLLRIDHILVSDEIGVSDAWTGSRWGSEHRPVIAEVSVPQ